jgi:hypothetical protein
VRKIKRAWETAEETMRSLGVPRTRENAINLSYVDLPEGWDDEMEEEVVPPDLRLYPAPDVPFPTLN